MAPERVTILTSCTGRKRQTPAPVAAEELYVGQHHLRLMRGVRALRQAGTQVDVWIVSAGHGVVSGGDPLHCYERTFQGRPASERRQMARELGIPQAFRRVLAEPTQLAIVLLGEEYLEACEPDADLGAGGPVLVLCSASAALRLPRLAGTTVLPLRTTHTRQFNCGFVGLKGEIVGRLLCALGDGRLLVGEVSRPELLRSLARQGPVQPSVVAQRLF
jgi:hypothetical protein